MTSKIKVDNINKVSDDSNIIKKCGTTITLGASGDSIALASGASQTGFGRTGTVDWQTTPKTATFTAVSGEGYFCNTSGGAFTVNLPAGSAGAIVSLADYAATWQTSNLTVSPNGSEKIGGTNANSVLNTEGQSVTFVFVDSTQGWINTMDSTSNVRGLPPFVAATGGTITTVCTDYKVHTFTGPGTFTVCSVGNPAGSDEVSYMVVAGGAGGGGTNNSGPYGTGGGGGAGGTREAKSSQDSYTASPLATTGFPVAAQGYAVVIGGGGAAGPTEGKGVNGNVSSVFSITSTGGGGGGARTPGNGVGNPGGSGGGGGSSCAGTPGVNDGGTGNTPSVTPSQGGDGGRGAYGDGSQPFPSSGANGGGGGGATVNGVDATQPEGGDGGAGATSSINGTPTARGGGGGGGAYDAPAGSGAGGVGGGGPGGPGPGSTSPGNGQAGTPNTGGGGGGGSTVGACGTGRTGGAGGSGIVIIRYKFQ